MRSRREAPVRALAVPRRARPYANGAPVLTDRDFRPGRELDYARCPRVACRRGGIEPGLEGAAQLAPPTGGAARPAPP